MKEKMKRLVCLLLVCCMAFVLVACGSSGSTTEATAAPAETAAPVETTATLPPSVKTHYWQT